MTEKSYAYGATDKPMLGVTIGQQLDAARRNWPNALALVSCQQGIRWTFEELAFQADRLASGLLTMGLEPGDRVGIWSPNNAEWIMTQFATAKAGLVLVNINQIEAADLVILVREFGGVRTGSYQLSKAV